MPNFNHKGPENLGPRTGMRLGKCKKSKFEDFEYLDNRPFRKGRRKKITSNKLKLLDYRKMKRIAIPITKNNTVENHFGQSEFYEIYTFSSEKDIIDLQLLEPQTGSGCKSNIIDVFVEEGVGAIISDCIGDKFLIKLKEAGINVIRGYSGNSADIILEFIENKLSDKEGHGFSCNQKNN